MEIAFLWSTCRTLSRWASGPETSTRHSLGLIWTRTDSKLTNWGESINWEIWNWRRRTSEWQTPTTWFSKTKHKNIAKYLWPNHRHLTAKLSETLIFGRSINNSMVKIQKVTKCNWPFGFHWFPVSQLPVPMKQLIHYRYTADLQTGRDYQERPSSR